MFPIKWYNKRFLSSLLSNDILSEKQTYYVKERIEILNAIVNYESCELANNSYIDSKPSDSDLLMFECNSVPTISIVMIVKNEERVIKRSIESVLDMADEIVIVDTGSQDQTIDIIQKIHSQKAKLKLYNFDWCDDFSKARNYAISKARSDWIFILDADEYITLDQVDLTKKYLKQFDISECRNRLAFTINVLEDSYSTVARTMHRIFRRDSGFSYYGLVHEDLISNTEHSLISLKSNIVIHHDGYSKEVEIAKKKTVRNMKLLEKMLIQQPNDPRILYLYLRDGRDLLNSDEIKLTICEILFGDENCTLVNDIDYNFELLDLLIYTYFSDGELSEVKRLCQISNEINPGNSNAMYYSVLSEILELKNQYKYLLTNLAKYRKSHFEPQIGMLNSNGYHIDALLATLLFETGQYNKAKAYLEFLDEQIPIAESMPILNDYKKLLKDD